MVKVQSGLDAVELLKRIAEQAEEIKQLKSKKKFGLVWEDKPDEQVLRVRDEAPMLCEDVSKAVVTDQNAVNHVLINGDNFHALTALRATHTGRVDVIYIDPPYNTGNKDFIYNDNYLDKEDGYSHSKWLSFMEKRLILARELLAETGTIFVSIDDNEQARLKLLLDAVFNEDNFLNTVTVKMSELSGVKMKHIGSKFPKLKEYVLVYAKDKNKTFLNVPIEKKDPEKLLGYLKYYTNVITNPNEVPEEWNILPIGQVIDLKNLSIEEINDWKIENADKMIYRTNSKTVSKYIEKNPQSSSIFSFYNADGKEIIGWDDKELLRLSNYISSPLGDMWNDISTINLNKESTGVDFANGQKPLKLIKRIISTAPANALVLDFFAGSGTTGNAVAELNQEDSGTRQCLLVTDGGKTETSGESSKNAKENAINIAEEITYERVRRVLTGKDWVDGRKHEPLGGNLRYFKVEMEPTPHGTTESDQRLALEQYTISHAKIATNIFNEVASVNELDDETLMTVDYKVYTDELNERYLVGVIAHDYALTDLKEWFQSLPAEATVVMVGKGLEEIEWVRKNSDRITVDDVLGRVIRSRKYVASKLPLV